METNDRVEAKVNLLKRYIKEAYPKGEKILDLVDEILITHEREVRQSERTKILKELLLLSPERLLVWQAKQIQDLPTMTQI